MDTDQTARSIRALQRARYLLPFVVLALVSGTAFAACSGGHAASNDQAAGWTFPAASPADNGAGASAEAVAGDAMSSEHGMDAAAAMDDAWAHRPEFTRASTTTEEAYRYALYNPQIVQWMPCYCGCGAMGHRSNLDCYIKPTADGQVTFEEHASYCDICVQITLKTRDLVAQGASLHDARAAIDVAFAGNVAGTPTEVPPR